MRTPCVEVATVTEVSSGESKVLIKIPFFNRGKTSARLIGEGEIEVCVVVMSEDLPTASAKSLELGNSVERVAKKLR